MVLHSDWRLIARRAWSFRLAAVAAIFAGAELVLPMFGDALPRGLFAAACFAASSGATVSRLVAQKAFAK